MFDIERDFIDEMDGTRSISDYIYDEYINKNELDNSDTNKQKDNLNLLVVSGYAMKITTKSWVYGRQYKGANAPEYCFMSYWMLKHNPDLEQFIKADGFTNSSPFKSKKLKKIFNTQMAIGVHYAHLKKKDFLALVVSTETYDDNGEREESIVANLYFISKKPKKYAKEYMKAFENYCEAWKKENNKTFVWSSYRDGENRLFKTFDQYIFSHKEEVLEYIDHWKKMIPVYYKKYNMVPKLSILLYGKPGTGKSTFYQCLANYLGFEDVVIINTDNINTSFPKRGFYIIDEIDLFCPAREEEPDDDSKSKNEEKTGSNTNSEVIQPIVPYYRRDNSFMLQKLLAFLDNPPSYNYKIDDGESYPVSVVVATTNFYNRLDAAVKRYGRFDLQIELKDFNRKEAEEMCKLYDLKLEDVISKGINKSDFSISPAKLQAKCLEKIDTTLKHN